MKLPFLHTQSLSRDVVLTMERLLRELDDIRDRSSDDGQNACIYLSGYVDIGPLNELRRALYLPEYVDVSPSGQDRKFELQHVHPVDKQEG